MNASLHEPDHRPSRHAPLALWRVAEAFMRILYALFGAPEDVAERHTLRAAPYRLLLSWLRCGDSPSPLRRGGMLHNAMHLTTPRIPPLTDDALTPEQAEALAPFRASGRPVLNIFRTLAREPEAFKAFLAWGNYILRKNALEAREREIVILRTGYLCKSGYEWTQHVGMVRRGGMSEEEIAAIKAGASAKHWSAADAALINACDELHANQFISDATWSALKAHFSEKQCMDVVFTAGQYTQVSMMLNSFGVQLEDGQELDPDLRG